jgi:hypothetical protein
MRDLFKDYEHLARVAALAGGGVVLFLLLQQLLVPEGFGLYGHYRAGALDDNRARDLAFAGQATCVECHTDEAAVRKAGKHAGVACEACHGALARHASDNEIKPEKPHGREVCLRCHSASVARPAKFPQIEPKDHAESGLCTECHQAHNPGMGS